MSNISAEARNRSWMTNSREGFTESTAMTIRVRLPWCRLLTSSSGGARPAFLPALLLPRCLCKRPSVSCQFLPRSLFTSDLSLLCVCVCVCLCVCHCNVCVCQRSRASVTQTDGELKGHEPYCDRRDSLLLSPELMAPMASARRRADQRAAAVPPSLAHGRHQWAQRRLPFLTPLLLGLVHPNLKTVVTSCEDSLRSVITIKRN